MGKEDENKGEGENENKPDPKEAKKVDKSNEEDRDKHEDDSIKWRAKYKTSKEELETIKARSESEKAEIASKLEQTSKDRTMFEQKYIDAEVKAQAVAAGIKDMEFVQLIPKGEIKLDEQGNVTGVEKAITELKARKPEWFGNEKKISSSSNSELPDKGTKNKVDARTMSKEDWNRNKGRFMAGRF